MTTRWTARLLALNLICGVNVALAAPPTPKAEEMARVLPRQAGVNVTTPTAAEVARLRVVPYPNAEKPYGFVLLDAANRPVRRFLAVNTPNYNIYSFYKDGQEVYRETDTRANGKIDLYRWLGTNGSKVGFDTDGNGSIDVWDAISPEEVSKEVFEAIVQKDAARFKSLLVNAKDLQSLGLPPTEADAILARVAKAGARFENTLKTMNLSDKAKWIHVELWAPETTPKDEFQGAFDLVRHRNAGVLVDRVVENKAETFQLGEMILVGRAWKLIDGPAPGTPSSSETSSDAINLPADVQAILTEISKLTAPPLSSPEHEKFQFERANKLAVAVAKLQNHPQQELFIRQMIEAYSVAAELSNAAALEKLKAWQGSIEKVAPKGALAGFVAYRLMGIEYSAKLRAAKSDSKQIAEVQSGWRTSLAAFIKTYPALEETPEALYRLALAEEMNGKGGEDEAKTQYALLAKNFPQHPLAPTANGAVRRLSSEGQPFTLAGTLLQGQPFNVVQVVGKPVVVFYWGSFHSQLKNDAAELSALQKKHGDKIAVVTVCLDSSAEVAAKAAQESGMPGVHLFDASGGLAAQYGVIGTQLFVIGKDGKVVNKNAQIALLADELDRVLK